MRCINCGYDNEPGRQTCLKCGEVLPQDGGGQPQQPNAQSYSINGGYQPKATMAYGCSMAEAQGPQMKQTVVGQAPMGRGGYAPSLAEMQTGGYVPQPTRVQSGSYAPQPTMVQAGTYAPQPTRVQGAMGESYSPKATVAASAGAQPAGRTPLCPQCGYPMSGDYCPNCGYDATPQRDPAPTMQGQSSGSVTKAKEEKDAPSFYEQLMKQPVTCKKCGRDVSREYSFCPYCGEHIEQETINPFAAGSFGPIVDEEPEPEAPKQFKLTPIEGNGQDAWEGRTLELVDGTLILNRDNTEPRNNSITSREQAQVSYSDGQWLLENRSDYGSTFVAALRPVELKKGDLILLGNRRFRFEPIENDGE